VPVEFAKYQGLGNDFVVVDGRSGPPIDLNGVQVQQLCDRRFGIGADGVILALPPQEGGDLRMRILNGDGSEPEMCGNGIRCLARFVADQAPDSCPGVLTIETLAGPMHITLQEQEQVMVDMGEPRLEPTAIPTTLGDGGQRVVGERLLVAGQVLQVTAVSMGNPHAVIPVADVEQVDLDQVGPAVETHPAFPQRTNVHFFQVLDEQRLRMRIWERGVGPTMACGTGACAVAVAAHVLGLSQRKVQVHLPGGVLTIHWHSNNHVFMTGPAQLSFVGQVALDQLQATGPNYNRWGAAARAMAMPAQPPLDGLPVGAGDQQSGAGQTASAATKLESAEPESEAEAYAQTMRFLANTSLDQMLELAANSLAQRTQRRGGPPIISPPGDPLAHWDHGGGH